MKLAIESPVPLLPWITSLTDFDFLLIHLLEEARGYKYFFSGESSFDRRGRTMILDNSENELGTPYDLDAVIVKAKEIGAHYICPPDYHKDSQRTLDSVKEALQRSDLGSLKILPVVHGSSLDDVQTLMNIYRHQLNLTRVALPYRGWMSKEADTTEMANCRIATVKKAIFERIDEIHLLGMNTLDELATLRSFPIVKSIDTSAPIKYGIAGHALGIDRPLTKEELHVNLGNVHTLLPADLTDSRELIFYNVAYLRKLIGG